MINVEAFQIQENHLIVHPELCGNDLGKFVIRDCDSRRLIQISETEDDINDSMAVINKYNEELQR